MQFEFHPVTPERWHDFERLFRESASTTEGEPAVCWCMEWRISRDDWEKGRGEGNRRAMQSLVESGTVPGILAYADGEPAGWCSISPRAQHGGLQTVAQYRNFENPSVWLVSCFYISEKYRGQKLMRGLLEAGVAYAQSNGASVIEGYPIDEATDLRPQAGLVAYYWGRASVFHALGFVEIARVPQDNRPVMRKRLDTDR